MILGREIEMRKMLVAGAAILALIAGVAQATLSLPPELADSPRDVRFLLMPVTPNRNAGYCPIGFFQAERKYSLPHCSVSINECLAIDGNVEKTPVGYWMCSADTKTTGK
jgi:hypothetical protein